jgi:hypothetical protein
MIVVNVMELLVYWSPVSHVWNQKYDDASFSQNGWTAREWPCCMNKSYLVNHICMVTNIGQIGPWWSLKQCTTHCVEHMDWLQSLSWGQMELDDIGVSQEMISGIGKGSVNCLSGVGCHIRKSGYIGCDAWNGIVTTERTLRNFGAMPYFREISISFFWVCRYNKLN